MKSKMILFALCIFLLCGCTGKTGTGNNNNDTENANDSIQESIYSATSNPDTQEIKEQITAMWFHLNIGPNGTAAVSKYLTDSFYSILSNCYNKYIKMGNNGELDMGQMLEFAEALYNWWGGEEHNPDGKFEDISVLKLTKNEAKVKVIFKNWTYSETHILYLKKEKGKWLLDNFDNQKEYLEKCLQILPSKKDIL